MATKKTKKIETPVDNRETFVSIQKNFADSDAAAQEKLWDLYELQQADRELDKIYMTRGELPSEVASIEEEIASLKAKSKEIADWIEGMNANINDNKQNIIDCDEQIAKYRAQLNDIANSREFDSINKEIENQGLLRQIAEKNIGEAKMSIGEAKADIESIKERVAVRTEDLEIKKHELDNIVSDTADQENALLAKRKEIASRIDDRTLSAYEHIRGGVKNHLAVVEIYNNDSCGGCFSTIIPQKIEDINSGRKLIICEHCGRIIVNPKAQSAE